MTTYCLDYCAFCGQPFGRPGQANDGWGYRLIFGRRYPVCSTTCRQRLRRQLVDEASRPSKDKQL